MGIGKGLRKIALAIGMLAGLAAAMAVQASGARADDRPGDFDFYVLSLSWSPSYCAAEGDRSNSDQCDSGRPYAFVVHGLWPQYDRGFPENCAASRRLDRDLVNSMLDIMPSRGLIRHEWEKHGTCSGLSAQRYFETVRQAYNDVVIPKALRRLEKPIVVDPDVLEKAFITVNEGLPADGIAVICRGNRIREVRVCFTKDLSGFRDCPEVDRNACTRPDQRMPPVRTR